MRVPGGRVAAAVSVVGLCLSGCATTAPSATAGRDELARGADRLAEGRLEDGVAGLNRVLELTHKEPRLGAQRFHAACLLAEGHVRAAVGAPFLPGDLEASRTAHYVSVLYHAGHARDSERGAVSARATEGSHSLLPTALAARDVEEAATRLDLHVALAYAGLGFGDAAGELLARRPALLRWETAVSSLEALGIAGELQAPLCAAISDLLARTDEREAYRFAVAAIEGGERFGHALPEEEVRRLEEWILRGARVRFVCPESGTEYLPGRRRSPKSGVPHAEYVPAPRPTGS